MVIMKNVIVVRLALARTKAYDHNKDLGKIKGTDQEHRPRNVGQTSKINIARVYGNTIK